MSNHPHRLPEPTMPENELIRAADTLPELSSGLRSSTMVLCRTHMAKSQRVRRIKAATASILVASLAVVVFTLATSPSEVDNQPVVEDSGSVPSGSSQREASAPISVSPGESPGTSDSLAVGLPGNKMELRRIDGKIDELQQRMLKAKMLPGLDF